MKTIKSALACICLIIPILMLGGCSKAEPLKDEIPELNYGDYKIVSGPAMPMSQYASYKDGCYSNIMWTTGGANVTYFDCGTNSQIFLSNQPNSQYKEGDSSWIENTYGGISTIATDKKVYIIKRGYAEKEDLGEDSRSYLLQMDFNGDNHKTMYLDFNEAFNEGGAIAYDGESLYYIGISCDYKDDKPYVTPKLYKVNEETLERTCVYEFDYKEGFIVIEGTYEHGLIIEKGIRNEYKKERELWKLDVVKKTFSKVEIDYSYDYNVAIYNNLIFRMNNKAGKLVQYNISTGESLPIELVYTKRFDRCEVESQVFDNRLIIDYYDYETGESERYYYDLESKIFKKIDLHQGNFLISILAETDEYFLTYRGRREVEYWNTAPDHKTKYIETRPVMNYFWISRENFWNSVPEYIEIEDKIVYR